MSAGAGAGAAAGGVEGGEGGVEGLAYAEAVAELEAILAELEDDRVDVDHLAARVARAADLIRLCRDRITSTRLEVERIVTDLDPPTD